MTEQSPLTVDEFIRWQHDSAVWLELVEGRVLTVPYPSTFQKRLIDTLGALLRRHTKTTGRGTVRIHHWCRFGDATFALPDIACFAEEARPKAGTLPTLIIEVALPDRVDEDRVIKRQVYESAGVEEFWFLKPWERLIVALRLEDGRYVETRVRDGHLSSASMEGFRLDLDDFWRMVTG